MVIHLERWYQNVKIFWNREDNVLKSQDSKDEAIDKYLIPYHLKGSRQCVFQHEVMI